MTLRIVLTSLILGLHSVCVAQSCLIVLDKTNGSPVSDASVSYESRLLYTDINGKVCLERNGRISVSHLNYKSLEMEAGSSDSTVVVYLEPFDVELDALVIKAAFVSESPGDASYRISRIAPSEIVGNPSLNALDAIGSIAGVQLQSGAKNTSRLTIRGMGSRSPYSTNRIKAYFAGIPLSGGDGETEMDDIDRNLLRAVDLVKGGYAALYGNGLAGVILLHPVIARQDGWHAEAGITAGSDDLIQSHALLSFGKQGYDHLIYGSIMETDGWRDNDNYKRKTVYSMQRIDWTNWELSLLLNLREYRASIPSSLNLEDYQNNPSKAADNWATIGGFEDNRKVLAGLGVEYKGASPFNWRSSLFYQAYDGLERRPFNTLDDRSHRIGLVTQGTCQAGCLFQRTGAEAYMENYDWQTYEAGTSQNSALLADYSELRSPIFGFMHVKYSGFKGLILEGGLGLNTLEYQLEEKTGMAGVQSYRFDQAINPFFAIRYEAIERLLIFASYGEGISYPTVQEALSPGGIRNTSLQPEKSTGGELGMALNWKQPHIKIEMTAYNYRVQDILTTERSATGEPFGRNSGTTQHNGLELECLYKPSWSQEHLCRDARFLMGLNIGWNTFSEFIDDGVDYAGNTLPGVPSFMLTGQVHLELSDDISLSWRYDLQSEQYLDDANTSLQDGYGLLSMAIGYSGLTRNPGKFSITLNLENITNSHYASMVVVNAPNFGGAPRYYYPGRPFNWRLAVKYSI